MKDAKKYTKFADVPQFVQGGSWECDFSPDRVIVNVDEWVEKNGLDLDPDFQRGHVWTERQRRAFLEFFFRGGRTARVLCFNCPSWHKSATTDYDDFVIVDGLQRLTAIREFVENRLKVFGSYFREYEDSVRIHKTFKINVNDLQTRADVLRWYLDFNSGGVVHTKSEIERVRRLLEKEDTKCR